MITSDLIDFENKVAKLYEDKQIRGPIHLRDGNEDILINIFKQNNIGKDDYVFSTWASHLHALLKGIPQELVLQQILYGNSITLTFPKYNFYTSAIVGGICPIATGVAWGLKDQHKTNRVFAFIGDMTVLTGMATECIRYSQNFNLPITFIIEDNQKSVCSPTRQVWQDNLNIIREIAKRDENSTLHSNCKIIYYKYQSKFPHSGVGAFIQF